MPFNMNIHSSIMEINVHYRNQCSQMSIFYEYIYILIWFLKGKTVCMGSMHIILIDVKVNVNR